jgi:phosphatidylglycerol:prolipoprotein diacylglycerol transferase
MYIDGSYYHPTFLYESLWNLLGFIILLAMRRLNPRRGELFIFYVIWYSIGRFFIEGMRTDSLMLTDSIRIAQLIGVVLIVLMLAIFFYRRKTGLANARYKDSIYLEQEEPKGE